MLIRIRMRISMRKTEDGDSDTEIHEVTGIQ